MGKLTFEIVEPDFNKNASSACQLSILIGVDSLVYLVLDAQRRLLVLKDYKFADNSSDYRGVKNAVSQSFDQEEFLRLPYRKITISLPNQGSTLVPNRLYNEADPKSYFAELTHLTEASSLQTDELPTLAAKMVYVVDMELRNLLQRQFPSGKFYHPAIPLIEEYKRLTASKQGFHLFVHVRDRQLQICLFENQNLQFYNVFSFATANDVLYYVLLIFDQFNLKPEETPLMVSGQLLQDAEIYRLFYRYITNLSFVPKPDFLKIGKEFEKTPSHLYFDLFALAGFVIR